MKNVQLFFFFGLIMVASIEAHSWLACADYKINNKQDEEIYNLANCKAFPRSWKDCCVGDTMGLDRGYNFQPQAPGGVGCGKARTTPLSAAYNDAAPMAQYKAGQKVCLAWPPKNHVAATCDNPNIPDAGLRIYMSGPNPTADLPVSQMTVVHSFPANPGADQFIGFQHCPKYCDDHDKSLCWGCFNIPKDVQVGATYTFVWWWAFHSESDVYSNCWDAEIIPGEADEEEEEVEEPIPCTTHEDCDSGICESSGFCFTGKLKGEGGLDAGGKAALVFAGLIVVTVVLTIAIFFYRDKIADKMPSSVRLRVT